LTPAPKKSKTTDLASVGRSIIVGSTSKVWGEKDEGELGKIEETYVDREREE
jgi:hypothetical protein